MGSSESKNLVVSDNRQGRSADQAFLGCVTERITEFRLPGVSPESLPSGIAHEFVITDELGNAWVHVASTHDRATLFNAWTGEPIMVIQQRPWASNFLKSWFRIFAFKPNRPGQDSTESFTTFDDHGVTTQEPLYLFAKVLVVPADEDEDSPKTAKRCCSSPDSVLWSKGDDDGRSRSHCSCSYSRYNGNEGGPEVWTASASGLKGEAQALAIRPADDERRCVALINPASYRTNEAGGRTCGILCAPGVDPVEAFCVCVIMSMISDGAAPVLVPHTVEVDSPANSLHQSLLAAAGA
jgi:hypothetical protein